jgi:hypothetical protein
MNIVEFSTQCSLVYYQIYGEVTYKEVRDILETILKQTSNLEKIKILSDYRNSEIKEMQIESLHNIARFVNENFTKNYRGVRWANLSWFPKQTACAILFSNLISKRIIDYQQFINPNVALNWLFIHPGCINSMAIKKLLFRDENRRLILYVPE